jgi:hypothetical protein
MYSAVLLALMLGPLAVYLYVIAVWHGGRTARLVAGPVDYGLLLFALGGLLVFGPVGRLLVSRAVAFGSPNGWAWLMVGSALSLLAIPWIPRSFRRLVVYNVDPETLDQALRAVVRELPGEFTRTLRGYEDQEHQRGLGVETTTWFRTAVIESYGSDAERLIRQLGRRLSEHLHAPSARPSAITWVLLGLCVALVAPVLALLLSRPQAQAVLRVLIERLHGG